MKYSIEKDRVNKTKLPLIVGLLLTFMVAYLPVWQSLINTWWSSEDYSHGFAIVPISCYIAWQKREDLSNLRIRSSALGLALLVFSLLLYVAASFAEIITLTSFSLVLSVAGMVLYLLGPSFLKELAFPIFLLLFMIPIPGQIYSALTIPLQLFVSKVSVMITDVIGVPLYREGNVIHIPNNTLQVVAACSGLRSMMSLWTLAAIMAYFTVKSNFLKLVFFLFATPISILVNIARVVILIIFLHYFQIDLTRGSLHTILGVTVFVFALILMMLVKGGLSRWDNSVYET